MLLSLTGISDYWLKDWYVEVFSSINHHASVETEFLQTVNTKSNRLLSASTRWEETYIMLNSKIPSPVEVKVMWGCLQKIQQIWKKLNRNSRNCWYFLCNFETHPHGQTPTGFQKHPKKTTRHKGPFLSVPVYTMQQNLQTSIPTHLWCRPGKEERKGETFERLQDTGGLYPPSTRPQLKKRGWLIDYKFQTANTQH